MAAKNLPPKTSSKQQADTDSAGLRCRTLGHIKIALIDTDDRLRKVNPERAEALAERFSAEGMHSPIEVVGPYDNGRYRLTFGGHRIAAQQINGALEIDALIEAPEQFTDDAGLRLREIAENVERFELSVLDRAVNVAAWREIHEARYGKIKRGGDQKSKAAQNQSAPSALWSKDNAAQKNSAPSAQLSALSDLDLQVEGGAFSKNFSEAAQQAFGLASRTIYEALKISTIAPDVRGRICFHPLANKKSDLLALATETHDRQAEIARLITDNQAASVAEAISIIDHVPAPKRPAALDKVSNQFSTLKPTDQHAFFEIHSASIEQWLLTRRK